MNHSLVRTVGTLAMVLSLAGVAQAQWKHCGINGLEGSWDYTETGTVVLPTAPPTIAQVMAVGRYTFERDGTVTAIQWGATQTAASNGIPAPPDGALVDIPDTKRGTYTVDEDTCTITVVLDGYMQATSKLLRRTVWQFFFADNGKEVRGISRKLLYYPNGYPEAPELNLLPVMTMIGTRFTPSAGEGEQGKQGVSTSSGTVTDGSCKTPDPFVTLGGGVCVAGGWRPRVK